ncbi:hypothetical protein C1I98_07575 [Spongiactinospora gelatinilytica]|uniref:Uncharacterized protein n=1 Tax=Spongiactinospora gelatinilytica TaxID=2666298 RepID=A0A2W2I1K0_9ACTN|nr:hypothetical protein [Spongiactinospora gelatinilytica]PZG52077.1 hypothetical protein C1I98_07575 [Spongiactinospora gelatinilytica]
MSWPEQADPDAYRVHVPDADRYGTAPAEITEEIEEEWRAHADPADALDEVARTAAAAAVADRRLTRAVRTALGCGASWAEVAAAARRDLPGRLRTLGPLLPRRRRLTRSPRPGGQRPRMAVRSRVMIDWMSRS